MLTLEKFIETTKQTISDISPKCPRHISLACDEIGVSWVTGGQGGGSCYDYDDETDDDGNYSDPHYEISTDEEPDFMALEIALSVLLGAHGYSPTDAQFTETRDLVKEIIMESGDESENEYYGNYTDSSYHTVSLTRLFNEINPLLRKYKIENIL